MFCNKYLATIDVKRAIHYIAANIYDTQIAIIENQGVYEVPSIESFIRIYDVGRSKIDYKSVSFYYYFNYIIQY